MTQNDSPPVVIDENGKDLKLDKKPNGYKRKSSQKLPRHLEDSPYHRDTSGHYVKGLI